MRPGFKVTECFLREAFCNFPDARRLTWDELGEVVHHNLES